MFRIHLNLTYRLQSYRHGRTQSEMTELQPTLRIESGLLWLNLRYQAQPHCQLSYESIEKGKTRKIEEKHESA